MTVNPPWADKKLTKEQRGHMAFRYEDWLLTKNVPSGGFRLLYAILQCLNEVNQFHCFPSIDYLAALIRRSPSTVWSMLPKLEKIGVIEIEWGSKGSGHPNTYRLPAAFLAFYFGPEKGQTPKPVLVPRKPRQIGVSKPRQIGVSDQLENPDTPPKKPRYTAKKPRHIGVSHFLATSSHKKERGSAARTFSAVRDSASKTTADAAPVPATDGSVARTAHAALNSHLAAQKQPSPERDATEIDTAAHADAGSGFEARRRAQFANIKRDWPPERIDEAEAYEAFCDAVAVRGLTAVVAAVQNLTLEDPAGDFPLLSDVLEIIGRDP